MIGKILKYNLLPILAGILLLMSCTDDEIVKGGGRYKVTPDIPVMLPLNVQLSGNKVSTRAAQSEEAERTINSIYVIAFKPKNEADINAADEDWILDSAKSFEVGSVIGSDDISLPGDFPISTGSRKIYAIGNPQSGAGTLTAEDLDGIKTLSDLKNLESLLRDKQSIERMNFKMAGQAIATGLKDGNAEVVTVTTDGNGGKGRIIEGYSLKLERVDARITFKINGTGEYTFTPEYYYVMNIPGGTYVIPREKDDKTETAENTWDSGRGGYTNGFRTSDFTKAEDGSDMFEFYMCENRQNPQERITRDALENVPDEDKGKYTLYSLRSKQEKLEKDENGNNVENGDFLYPDEHSTYVILGGTVTGVRNDEKVYAKVSYRIFLGDTGNSSNNNWQNDEDLVNNYDIERNTHYTYNVTIAGVDRIIVEAESDDPDEEPDPGAEGDVILTTGDYVTLDSHYSRYVMTLKKEEIMEGLSWSITTPFQRGLQVFDKNLPIKDNAYLSTDNTTTEASFGLPQNTLSLNDYKWVKFAINKECIKKGSTEGWSRDEVIKFPGEQAYDGGTPEKLAPIAGGEYYKDGDYYEQVRLYDVNQLLNFLYYKVNNGPDDVFDGDEVTMTVFIDEYYYIYDPTRYFYRKPTGVDEGDTGAGDAVIDLSLWKKVVNTENRLLNICVEGSKYSPDGQSSVSRSVYTISQNPIYSFYNPAGSSGDFNTAWGVEASVETTFLPVTPSNNVNGNNFINRFSSGSTDLSNGRANQLKVLYNNDNALRWDAVINTDISKIETILKSDYRSVWYACLMRNRDLNGDDIIDASEVRWYLASIDQLTDMWIGEAGIPSATLYQAETLVGWVPDPEFKEGVSRVHVASSSYYTGDDPENNRPTNATNPWVLWAEEGASRGDVWGSGQWANVTNFSYRCVRNLGISLADPDAVPDDYVKYDEQYKTTTYTTSEGETYNELILDVSRMADNCIRPSTSGNAVLPAHTERDPYGNNRPPLQLAVICDSYSENDSKLYPLDDNKDNSIPYSQMDQSEITNRVCPLGYRIPNQRELMLIQTTFPDLIGQKSVMCKTTFGYTGSGVGLDDNGTPKKYFGYAGGSFFLSKGDKESTYKTGKVRCVRDATNNPGGN